jgi:hypothetical protein
VTKIKQLGNFAIGVGSAKRDLGRDLCNWKRPWALKSDARERKKGKFRRTGNSSGQ